MTSASFLKRNSGATGPKVSSRASGIAGVDVGEHGRFEEGAPERVALAADVDARAFRERVGDMALDLGHRLLVDQRALVDAGLGAVADA